MRSVEVFVILAMAALNFTVMPWGKRSDAFVLDAKLRQGALEQRGTNDSRTVHFICKFRSVVSLDTFNRIRKALDTMSDKGSGRK